MRIIGISTAHDSSVAIINDGIIESYYKEERFTKTKRDSNPYKSFIEAIKLAKGDIDMAVISSPTQDISVTSFNVMCKKLLGINATNYTDRHHECHASLAFYNSGFEEALVFVIDRNGSILDNKLREAETVFQVTYPCNFKTLHKNYWSLNNGNDCDYYNSSLMRGKDYTYNIDSNFSIVKVYESATTLIGEHPLENGKTMGLSAYGEDKDSIEFFIDGRPRDNLFFHGKPTSYAESLVYNRELFSKRIDGIPENNYQFYADYAFQIQKQTQREVLNMISHWVNKTGIKNVCVTGGYGLNVVSNNNLIKSLPEVNFYFEPLADDSGNSIGAAMLLYRSVTGDKSINPLTTTAFHGVESKLNSVGVKASVSDISKLLIDQKIVAVFKGLSEAGPRALGNRSLLFDARNPNAKQIVNKVKNREWYRPFAGIILEDKFSEYFDTLGCGFSDFMTVSFNCKTPELFPGVCHVDNSCRVQTINRQNDSCLYELLTEFDKDTKCPILLNTSFNMAGEPLVETQEDAIKAFNNSSIDALWFPEIGEVLLK